MNMPASHDTPATWFSGAVGAMDALTGVLMVAIPARTASLFGANLPAGDDVGMRFVGAFVLAVGLTYLWAIVPSLPAARACRLRVVWGATALIRLVIAVFVASAVWLGRMESPWLAVSVTDAGVATIQIIWLRGLASA